MCPFARLNLGIKVGFPEPQRVSPRQYLSSVACYIDARTLTSYTIPGLLQQKGQDTGKHFPPLRPSHALKTLSHLLQMLHSVNIACSVRAAHVLANIEGNVAEDPASVQALPTGGDLGSSQLVASGTALWSPSRLHKYTGGTEAFLLHGNTRHLVHGSSETQCNLQSNFS